MKKLFSIGGIDIHLFGIFIALGVMAGLYVVSKEIKRKGLKQNETFDLAIYSIIVGIIGARLNYILAFNPSFYFNNPREIFMIQNGGLSIQGALIAGVIFAILYMKKKKMPIWETADAFSPAIILGQGIGRVGCDVFGIPMVRQLLWGINVGGQLLHPAQIYEALLNYFLFFILWNKRKSVKYNGQIFTMYIIGFSLNRFIVEFFRENPLVIGRLSVAHIYSIIFIAIAIVVDRWIIRAKQMPHKGVGNDTNTGDSKKEMWLSAIAIGLLSIMSVVVYYLIHILL